MKYFVRCCVDLDPAGNAIGWSYEAHDRDGGVVALGCGVPEPFETICEALGDAVTAASLRLGLQSTLPGF